MAQIKLAIWWVLFFILALYFSASLNCFLPFFFALPKKEAKNSRPTPSNALNSTIASLRFINLAPLRGASNNINRLTLFNLEFNAFPAEGLILVLA
jgi:hypothetical protein